METIIKVIDLLGSDIRSRLNAERIRNRIDGQTVVDFSGVKFMSRSFADELYNICNEKPLVRIEGMSDFVLSMYNAVLNGRNRKRVRKEDNGEILKFDKVENLSEFLLQL